MPVRVKRQTDRIGCFEGTVRRNGGLSLVGGNPTDKTQCFCIGAGAPPIAFTKLGILTQQNFWETHCFIGIGRGEHQILDKRIFESARFHAWTNFYSDSSGGRSYFPPMRDVFQRTMMSTSSCPGIVTFL